MCSRESHQPVLHPRSQIGSRLCRFRGESDDAAGNGEQVFDPMMHFLEQKLLMLGGPLALRDVSGDFRCADDLSVAVPNRRDGERDIDQGTVFASSYSLEVIDALAGLDASQNGRLLFEAIGWNNDRDRVADSLVCRIFEKALSALVSARNDSA